MKRILLIGLMVLAMVQCSSISSTEDVTIDKLNTDISVPKITLSDGQIVWDDIDGVDAYEILIIDLERLQETGMGTGDRFLHRMLHVIL